MRYTIDCWLKQTTLDNFKSPSLPILESYIQICNFDLEGFFFL